MIDPSVARERIVAAGWSVENLGRYRLAGLLGIGEHEARRLLAVLRSSATKPAAPGAPPPVLPLDELAERVKAALPKDGAASLRDLSERLDRSESTIAGAIKRLQERGVNVIVRDDGFGISAQVEPGTRREIVHDVSRYHKREVALGFVADNHLGSKHCRLDVLNAAYDFFVDRGIDTVYNLGNWIEGECAANRHDISVFGLTNQIKYWVENYPQRKGIVTRYIAGDDHEGWYQKRELLEIGEYAQNSARAAGRDDLEYIGYLEANVEFRAPGGSRWMKLMHPKDGSTYAYSYTLQRLAESFQGGEKPAILAVGHHHKFDLCYPREIYAFMAGCTCDQSIFMRGKKIQAHVGFCWLRFTQEDDGTITQFSLGWVPFYDRGYYEGRQRKF